MPTPYDLQTLHQLRSRGQCPTLPVFVVDHYDWQQKLLDLGALCIRVRNPQDHKHDWSAIRGLHCILVYRQLNAMVDYQTGGYGPLAQSLLAAEPAVLETFHPHELMAGNVFSRMVLGNQSPLQLVSQRDELLWRLLVK